MPTRKWKTEILVNTTVAGNQDHSSVTALADGGFVVAWHDSGTTSSLTRFQRYDAVGVRVGNEVKSDISATENESNPSVVQLSDGKLWISRDRATGPTDQAAYGSVVDLAGNFVREQIGQDTASLESQTVVASLGNNGSVIVWRDQVNQGDIMMRGYNADGTSKFVAATVNTNAQDTAILNQTNPAVAASRDGSKFSVSWYDEGNNSLRTTVVTANGTPVVLDTEVSDFNGTNHIGTNYTPAVVWLDNSRYVITWTTASASTGFANINFAICNDGNVTLGQQLVNVETSYPSENSAITRLNSGGFMIAWQQAGGVDSGIHLQAFDSGGNRMGEKLAINAGVAPGTEVSLATLSDGRVAVSWTDSSLSGTQGSDIRVQIVDPRDGIINGTTGADRLYGHDSVGDVISGGDGADFLYGLAGADTIYGGSGINTLDGGRGDDTIYGGKDTDYILGELGDDEQYGGDGNDIIYSAGGADLMDGGAGTGDAAFYVNELLGVTINLTDQLLTAGAALGDTLFNFERVYGSVRGANTLTGDTNANILVGGLVADTLNGGGNADVLRGWGGVDTMSGGTGNDIFQYTGNTEGGDFISDFATGDKFQFVRTAFGNLAGANVAATNFLSVASGNTALDAAQKFIFDQATKQLWYDADGSGVGAGVMIADLTNSYNIVNTDLLLA